MIACFNYFPDYHYHYFVCFDFGFDLENFDLSEHFALVVLAHLVVYSRFVQIVEGMVDPFVVVHIDLLVLADDTSLVHYEYMHLEEFVDTFLVVDT